MIVICLDFAPSNVDASALIETSVDSFETTGTDLLLISGETTCVVSVQKGLINSKLKNCVWCEERRAGDKGGGKIGKANSRSIT